MTPWPLLTIPGNDAGRLETPCKHPAPSPGWMLKLAADRRTTRASSAGATTAMESSGMATHRIAAMVATVVPDTAMDLHLSCLAIDATEVEDGTMR